MIQLRKGDCLELMRDIPDKSIDAIIADLPYGTTACKWDTIIPFEPLWAQYKRIIKDNGAIVLFGAEPFSSALRMSNLVMYKYDWVWVKNGNSGDFAMAKNKPLSKNELISVFSFGTFGNGSANKMKYNPQNLVYSPKKVKKKDGGDSSAHRPGRKIRTVEFESEYTNYPNTILTFSKDKGLHPTQKPLDLLEYLIKTYTNEGETVLDNTMGSGTTGVACVNTNRGFIGMELDDKYFEIAKERIEKAIAEKANFLSF